MRQKRQAEYRIMAALLAAVLLLCIGCGSRQADPGSGTAEGQEVLSGEEDSGQAGQISNPDSGMPAAGAYSAESGAGEAETGGEVPGSGISASDMGMQNAGADLQTGQEDTQNGQTDAQAGPAGTETDEAYTTEEAYNEDAESAHRDFDREIRVEQQIGMKLQAMTLQQKVAQMFVVTPDALTGVQGTTVCGDITRDALSRLPAGGLIFMRDNLQNAEQTGFMLQQLRQASFDLTGLPMFFFTDEEGGTVTRISGNEGFPEIPLISSMAVVGTTGDPAQARSVGETIGGYLASLGFNADFAPDADVLSNPDNQVIGLRSFGSDPQMVGNMAVSLGQGLESQGIIACYKHFPGHGATAADTHEGYAYTNKTLEQLQECELIPFQKAIDEGAQMIMVAHMSLPNVIGYTIPASLSPYILQNILREQMGFNGIIITDAMNMGAIAEYYTSADAAIQAVQAGVDMILMPADLWGAYTAVVHAVENGQISEKQIDDSVKRILRVKAQLQDGDS